MTNIITLKFEDCYCNIFTFYENVAKKLCVEVTDNTEFDCRKICVTKSVQEAIWTYFREQENMDGEDISVLWLLYGPKANIDDMTNRYLVSVETGFVISG